jgi:hypothetical protein
MTDKSDTRPPKDPDGDPSLGRSIEVETRIPVEDPAVGGPKTIPVRFNDKTPAGIGSFTINISDVLVEADATITVDD